MNTLGQRTTKSDTVGGVTTLTRYVRDDAGRFVGEYLSGESVKQEVVYLGDMPIAVMIRNEVLVDNNAAPPATTRVGTWTVDTVGTGFWGPNYRYASAGTGEATFTWTPEVPESTSYNVYARWPDYRTTATSVPYKVYHRNGTNTVNVNQSVSGGQWNLLGKFDMDPGVQHRVELTNIASDVVIADAVKIVKAPGLNYLRFVETNQIEAPLNVINRVGAVLWTWDPAPFGDSIGNLKLNDDVDGNLASFEYNQRFPGQTFDRETGFNYNYLRDCYDPMTGRYCQPDPIGLAGGINPYRYVDGRPLQLSDREGLEPGTSAQRGYPSCNCYKIITIAQSHVGEEAWATNVANGRFPIGSNKCNLFVCDVISEAMGSCPSRWGGLGGPVSAGTWGDPSANIPGFPVVTTPKAGDIVAVPFPYTDASGHVGFVSGPGKSISAPGGPVTSSGWPFDPKSKPQGTPVFRRCTCDN